MFNEPVTTEIIVSTVAIIIMFSFFGVGLVKSRKK
ncbi:hypothetical protein ThvES_00001830 [Thiovulum sp. ES]|jgi:hypothetical protein|nr:hypothetical protein ThvES_00001830 [Thiovulum sp. ES]